MGFSQSMINKVEHDWCTDWTKEVPTLRPMIYQFYVCGSLVDGLFSDYGRGVHAGLAALKPAVVWNKGVDMEGSQQDCGNVVTKQEYMAQTRLPVITDIRNHIFQRPKDMAQMHPNTIIHCSKFDITIQTIRGSFWREYVGGCWWGFVVSKWWVQQSAISNLLLLFYYRPLQLAGQWKVTVAEIGHGFPTEMINLG